MVNGYRERCGNLGERFGIGLVIVRDCHECSKGNVMNECRCLYAVVVINQPKKIITVSTR